MTRAGKMVGARRALQPSAWLTPAVEFLQSQRVRMMMMMKLAEATKGFDVYIVASNNAGGTVGRAGGPGAGAGAPDPAAAAAGAAAGAQRVRRPRGRRRGTRSRTRCRRRWQSGTGAASFDDGQLGVLSGDQRAERLRESGQPTNVTFFARPFGETAMLALARHQKQGTVTEPGEDHPRPRARQVLVRIDEEARLRASNPARWISATTAGDIAARYSSGVDTVVPRIDVDVVDVHQ